MKGIEEKIKNEVKQFSDLKFDAPVSPSEEPFLGKINKLILTDDEKEELLRPTSEEEINLYLKQ